MKYLTCSVIYVWCSLASLSIRAEDETLQILFPEANGNFHSVRTPSNRGAAAIQKTLTRDDTLQEEANTLRNIDDFANFYDVALPGKNDSVSIANRIRGPSSRRSQELQQATCIPELTAVPLDLPEEGGTTFFPTCVRVERCGGCCFLSHHSCQPTEKENILVKAVKIKSDVTRSRRRTVRNAESDFIEVAVEKHLKCECKCRLMANECNPSIQTYEETQCDCVCKDKMKQAACLGSRDHYWDFDSCQCICRRTLSCSSGQQFDHTTCSCR